MTIDSSDVRSHGNEQIMNAVAILQRSEDRRKVFEEIYRGKNGKTSAEIASKIKMDKIRVLQETGVLCKSQLIAKQKVKGKLLFFRVDYFSLHKDRILRLAVSKKAREEFETKVRGKATNIVIKLPLPRKTIDIQHLTIDDIDSFKKVGEVQLAKDRENLPILEEVFQKGLQKIIGEQGEFKDWGGEGDDLYSTRLILNGKRIPTAFGLKGRGTTGKLTPKKLGKQGDQIQRLFRSPAEVFIIQYWDQIGESVCEQMKMFATAKSVLEGRKIFFGEIDGQDTLRLLQAYANFFGETLNGS